MAATPPFQHPDATHPHTIDENAVLEKTLISKNFPTSLSNRQNTLILSKQQLVQSSVKVIAEIHREYSDYPDQISEIAMLYKSPSFKMLLEKNCFSVSVNVLGIPFLRGYDLAAFNKQYNTICLSLEETLKNANTIQEFEASLAELIRHEGHHGVLALMQAPFYLRPDIPPERIPCSYYIGQTSIHNQEVHIPFSHFGYNREITKPFLPFFEQDMQKLLVAMRQDLAYLDWVLQWLKWKADNPNGIALNPLPFQLRDEILKRYKPYKIAMAVDLEKDYSGDIPKIEAAIERGESHCIEVLRKSHCNNHGFCDFNFKLPLCVQEMVERTNNRTSLIGYSVPVPENPDKPLAFVRDLEWRFSDAVVNYDTEIERSTIPDEIVAWSYMIPQNLHRLALKNLEQIRIENMNKLLKRDGALSSCNDVTNSTKINECLQELCSNDMFLLERLKQWLDGRYRVIRDLSIVSGCRVDNPDLSCTINYIRSSLKINATDASFNRRLNPDLPMQELSEAFPTVFQFEKLRDVCPEAQVHFNTDAANAMQEVMTSPFGHHSLALHGLVFLATYFREEMANNVLKALARGDEKRYQEWKEGLKYIKDLPSVQITRDLGEMALRRLVPKDILLTERVARISKDFMNTVQGLQKDSDVYWDIVAHTIRAIDLATSHVPDALPSFVNKVASYVPSSVSSCFGGVLGGAFYTAAHGTAKAVPYISISGLATFLKIAYKKKRECDASNGSVKDIFGTLIENLALLIPGGQTVLTTAKKSEFVEMQRKLRRIQAELASAHAKKMDISEPEASAQRSSKAVLYQARQSTTKAKEFAQHQGLVLSELRLRRNKKAVE